MININEILDTIHMTDQQHLDAHTITMGISLLGCADPNPKAARQKTYDKIIRRVEYLAATGEATERGFDIPIVNKRIPVTPMVLVVGVSETDSYVPFAVAMDNAAKSTRINFIGGFSALVQKGATQADKKLIASIPEALAITDFVCSSVNVGSTRTGINTDVVVEMGCIIKDTAGCTADRGGSGCVKLVVSCNVAEDNPFMVSTSHGVGEPDYIINVGASGPGVVHHVLKGVKDQPLDVVAETVKKIAFRVIQMGQLVAQEASRRLGVLFGIVDLSLVPTPAIGDSMARILEKVGLEICDTHGTTAALALLNDAAKKGGTMVSSHVDGLSGVFIPVNEDEGTIAAARLGALHLDKLETMTYVYPVGLDIIAVPGDTIVATLSAIIVDEVTIGTVNSKTTAVCPIPAPGKVVGDTVEFGGLLGSVLVMPVHAESSDAFVARGGRILVPMQSLKN